jgi:hypothetical protein
MYIEEALERVSARPQEISPVADSRLGPPPKRVLSQRAGAVLLAQSDPASGDGSDRAGIIGKPMLTA